MINYSLLQKKILLKLKNNKLLMSFLRKIILTQKVSDLKSLPLLILILN